MKKYYLLFILFASIFFGLNAQIAIINFDFDNGSPSSYSSVSPLVAPNISGTVTSTEGWSTTSGTLTGTSTSAMCNGYASNTAGSALTSNSLNTGSHSYIFKLDGSNLSCYSSYKVYFDARSTSTGPTLVTLQYSIAGVTYTTSTTTYSGLNAPGSVWTECNFDLSSITALDGQSSLYFKIIPTGATTAGGTFSIDNFQVQAIQTSCFPIYTLGPNALTVFTSESGLGCDGNCNMSVYNQYFPTCTTGCATGSPGSTHYPMSATLYIPSACSATITAEYGYPFSQSAGMCPDSRMDGGDKLGIAIGTGTTTNVGTCSFNSSTSTMAASGSAGVVSTGCSGAANADESVSYVTTGPATITIWGAADRSDEVIIYSANFSTAACYTTVVTIVLPIELISFVAFKNNEDINIKWATITETNNDYFEIEHSIDAINFITTTKVKGAGNSHEKIEYNYMFKQARNASMLYFRLKQVDFNGNYKYSPIINLGTSWGTKNTSKNNINTSYNIENDKITTKFNLEFPQEVTIGLYDITGAKLYEVSELYTEGNNEVFLTAPCKMGIYVLVYQNGNAAPIRKKIIIFK